MSRTNTRAVVRAPQLSCAHVLRIGLGIAAVASLLAFNSQAGAQQTTSPIAIRPFGAVGASARTYNLRDVPDASAQTNALGYSNNS